jgi:hypothetical protein
MKPPVVIRVENFVHKNSIIIIIGTIVYRSLVIKKLHVYQVKIFQAIKNSTAYVVRCVALVRKKTRSAD